MARNPVQFQYGLSLSTFLSDYGSEEQCSAALFKWRWPKGFICPNCGRNKYCKIAHHSLCQCNYCHRQTSVTAGTLFASTKLPLKTWFLGMYFLTQDKRSISTMALHRQLGISYNAAWRMKHKLMHVMFEREEGKVLDGWIEVDDAYVGGERHGGKVGRGAEGKTPFIAAVSTNDAGYPLYCKLTAVTGFTSEEVTAWRDKFIRHGSVIVSDGLACFTAFSSEGYSHDRIVCGGGLASVQEPEIHNVNTMLGNLKGILHSTYHAIRPKFVQRYLADFQYRYNRRFKLENMLARLAYVALRTAPMPEKLLKIGLG